MSGPVSRSHRSQVVQATKEAKSILTQRDQVAKENQKTQAQLKSLNQQHKTVLEKKAQAEATIAECDQQIKEAQAMRRQANDNCIARLDVLKTRMVTGIRTPLLNVPGHAGLLKEIDDYLIKIDDCKARGLKGTDVTQEGVALVQTAQGIQVKYNTLVQQNAQK